MKEIDFIKDFDFIEHMMCCVIGQRRSGKSYLISQLLKGPLKSRFKPENIFIFCPSLEMNADYDQFKNVNKFVDPDPNIILEIMNEAKYVIKSYGAKRCPNILILLDDCADNKIIQYHSILETLAIRGRHYHISVIIASQRLRSISPVIRVNSDYMIIFSPYSFAEIQKWSEEFVAKERKRQLFYKLEEIFNVRHSFILLDNTEYLQKNKLKQVKDGKVSVIDLTEQKVIPEALDSN